MLKHGLACQEMKPLLRFHVINRIFLNVQLRQCQRPVLAQRPWEIFAVISLYCSWETHYCQRAAIEREETTEKV